MSSIIGLTGLKHDSIASAYFNELLIFVSLVVSVCAILSLLSGFIAVQNPFEKNLRVIAFSASCLTLAMFFGTSPLFFTRLSFNVSFFFQQISSVLFTLSMAMAAIIIPLIFKRKLTAFVKIFIFIYVIVAISIGFLPSNINSIFTAITSLGIFGICVYYVVSSWKTLKGAQWAIVVGLLISIGSLIVSGFFAKYLAHHPVLLFLGLALFVLSFPLALMVYIAMRFKEILVEVQLNAAQVLQLSEEKKEDALNRQRVLEEEVNRQTAEIRSNQARLVQAEKMASLGELTAGIAHEIQNPLNFVNNFSDVSVELIDEMQSELKTGDKDEAIAISEDIKQNLEKIRHHGKRADFIVKGMLEHSRTSSGEKQPTDLNVLCDEFLKLSYHGLRAKDKNFNAELVTHFYENLPKANISQQDMGRVMLNLFNNAFYAVNQKLKTAGSDYKPTVEVSTTVENDSILIKVKDNGNGIADAIKDKIMQPFFTTKPTGEGTGLGLSLSYDIVVKGHGGSIAVDSKEGAFTQFMVILPLKEI
jgi:signal transduction histidine kinase